MCCGDPSVGTEYYITDVRTIRAHLVLPEKLPAWRSASARMTNSILITRLTNKGWPTSSNPNVFNAAVGIRPRYAVCPDHTGSVIDLSLRDSSSFPRNLASSAKALNIDRRTADLIPSLPIRTSHVADVPSRNCRTRESDGSEGSVYDARRFEKWIGMLVSRCLARSFCSTDLWNVYTSMKLSA